MERDIFSLPIEILARIVASASQDVKDMINWRITSRSFKTACMQVLQHPLEVTAPDGPEFDRNNSQSAPPILVESSRSLDAALRMCPLLRKAQWRPSPESWDDLFDCITVLRVSRCSHLTHLTIARCRLMPGTLWFLGESRSLKVLSLRRSRMYPMSEDLYDIIWKGFPQLQCLDLSWFQGVSSNNLRLVGPQLISLSVHGCRPMREEDDNMLQGLCRHLRSCMCLDICGAGLCDEDILSLTEAAPELRTLLVRTHSCPSRDPWTEGAMSELQRRRPDVIVRELPSDLSAPLTLTEYERLGSRPSTS